MFTSRGMNLYMYVYGVLVVLYLVPCKISAQSNITANGVQCRANYKCFSSEPRNITIVWGYNGHICAGQSIEECYGESDPRGFVPGPRQWPVTIQQDDRLFFKASDKTALSIKTLNVSKSDFDNCNLNGSPVKPDLTSSLFEVPLRFLATTGIKYFVAESNSMLYRCTFGLKLEVYVRSRQPCINPSSPVNGVCSNKGLCATIGNFFTINASCICQTGYLGSYCEDLDSCHSTLNPCRNGATCVDGKSGLENDYNCSCVAGYDGKDCGNNINNCIPDPCKNGICLDNVNDYKCLCSPGYLGKNCSNLIPDPCDSKPCKNGGTCKRVGSNRLNYTCTCTLEFKGQYCTENVTSSSVQYLSTMITTSGKPSVVFDDELSSTSTLGVIPSTTQVVLTQTNLPDSGTTSEVTTNPVTVFPRFTITSTAFQTTLVQSHQTTTQLFESSFHAMSSSIALTTATSSQPVLSSYNPSSSVTTPIGINVSSESRTFVESSSILNTSTIGGQRSTSTEIQKTLEISANFTSTSTLILITSLGKEMTLNSITPTTASSTETLNTSFAQPTLSTLHSIPVIQPSTTSNSSTETIRSSITSEMFSKSIQTALNTSTASLSSDVISTSTVFTLVSSVFHSSNIVFTKVKSMHTTSVSTAPTYSITSTTIRESVSDSVKSSTFFAVLSTASSSEVIPTTVLTDFSTTTTPVLTTSKHVPILSSSQSLPLATTAQILPTTTFSMVPPTSSPTTIPIKQQTCKNSPCDSGKCSDEPDGLGLNFTCQCSKPTYGPRCSTDFQLHFPRFSNNSYLVHKPIAFTSGMNKIVITFKTTAESGSLFYSTHSKYRDFIQLYITNGKLQYRFDPGESLVIITSKTNVNHGKMVTAVVSYNTADKKGTLKVDSHETQTASARGRYVGINLYNDWYIGGLPPGKKYGANDGAVTTPGFIGCIKDIELNNDDIKFTEAADWNDISECDTPCTNNPCRNNGTCIPDDIDPHDYECNCHNEFYGINCKNHTVCKGDPCNGGTCIALAVGLACLCPFGREGITCQNGIDITVPKFSMAYNYSSYLSYQTPILSGAYFGITLQFKVDNNTTSAWDNALIMYSGQDQYPGKGDDFIALGIIDGHVVFQYDLGSGIARIKSDPINRTQEWHSVTAIRKGREGSLYLDNQGLKRGSSPPELSGLNLFSPLYIGGVPDLTELPTTVDFKQGFQGWIVSAAVRFGEAKPFTKLLTKKTANNSNDWPVVNGRSVIEKSYDGCNKSSTCQNGGTCENKGAIVCTCVNGWKGMYCSSRQIPCIDHNPCAAKSTCREKDNEAVCDCPLGKTGKTCADVVKIQNKPQFKDNSYMAFSSAAINVRLTTQIVIIFKPSKANGLLFYVAHKISSQTGDFLSISLHNGFVRVHYGLGSGTATKQNQNMISLNKEHTVIITREKQKGSLKVDNEVAMSFVSPGSAVALDVGSHFYLGGVPKLSTVNPRAIADVQSLRDFVGCVSSVKVNGVALTLTETGALEGRNIDNCPSAAVSS